MDHSNNLGYLLNKAARMTKWDLTNRLSEEGITSAQWGLLKDIYITEKLCKTEEEQMQRLTPASIAERLHADRPTVSCMIERLVKQDMAYRVSNPKDRRSQIILPTDKLKEVMPKLEQLSEITMEKAVRGFGDNEIELFKQYLNRIIDNLGNEEV